MSITVHNVVTDPSGSPLKGVIVRVALVVSATTSRAPGYTTAGDIISTATAITDADGTWSMELVPNSAITPANTFYRVSEIGYPSEIVVPSTGGPYLVGSILASPPPTPAVPGITGVQIAADGTVAGNRPEINLVSGTNVTVTAVDNPSAGRVDVTVTSSGGGGDSGTPSDTVATETTYGQASAAGSGTEYSRGDHTHGSPSLTSNAPSVTEGIGQAAVVGVATAPARADHVHPLAASGAPTASALGDTQSTGSATTFAASDHRHAREALGGVPGSSAVTDTAAAGAATTSARVDHVHGREGFGAVSAQTTYGASSATGSATTVSHSDHVHGTPALTTNAASTSAVGDSATVGVGTVSARDDHKHGREAFGSAPATTEGIGTSAAVGTATTPARSDHVHPMAAAGAPTASAIGDSGVTGSATTFAASDHKHAREALGGAATNSAVGDSAAAGSGTTSSRVDHVHGREAFGAVTAQTSFGASSSNGVAATEARSDHAHGTPAAPTATSLGLGTAATHDIAATGNASSSQVVFGNDTRLSDSRTPSAHAASHASAGSDPIIVAESQVTNLTTDLGNKQPLDADLTAIAALTPTANDILQFVSSAWTNRTMGQLFTALGLGTAATSASTAFQAADSDLTTIAGLTATTDNMIQSVGSAWASRTPAQVKAALAIVQSDVSGLTAALALLAPLASPALTGTATVANATLSGRLLITPDTVTVVSTTFTIDASTGNDFDLAPVASFTLANPTNPSDGQVIRIRITQDATGGRLVTLGTVWNAGPNTITLSTGASKCDHLVAKYSSARTKWDIVGFQAGY